MQQANAKEAKNAENVAEKRKDNDGEHMSHICFFAQR